MNVRREDKIGTGCAFTGALLGGFVFAPLFGGTPAIFTAIGVGLGWSVAKTIIAHLDASDLAKSQADAEATQAQNDADFGLTLMDHDESDVSLSKGTSL